MVQNWLKICLESHIECPKPMGDFMPTRLLEIEYFQNSKYPRLRLRESFEQECVPYAALSYCWGGDQPVKTTTENTYQHLIRLNYTELPATIRDAITISWRLGFRYLWIDSLCIVQNESRDKNYEIGQMPSIYSQATVTISASCAASVREGFLHDRMPLNSKSQILSLTFPNRCENGSRNLITLIPRAKEEEELAEPLSNRGWALQERLLSTRVIEYGRFQTRWICMHEGGAQTDEMKQSFGTVDGLSDTVFRRALDFINGRKSSETTLDGSHTTHSSKEPGLDRWKDILERYTRRTLTLPTDRLPAISGVVMRLSRILNDEYCAGLWKSDIIVELLWAQLHTEKLAPRPQEYQGPSWSWAAIDGSITFRTAGPSGSVDAHFSVVDVHIQPVKSGLDIYDAKFGAVESGRLLLKGKLKAAYWIRPQKMPPGFSLRRNVIRRINYSESDPDLSILFRADAIEEEFERADKDHIPVFLLKIFERRRSPDIVFQSRPPMGLVLRRNGESEYTRLGIF